jgi:phenylalanyl-tRNA synthetase beta chain
LEQIIFLKLVEHFKIIIQQIIEEEKLAAVFQFPKYSQLSLDWFFHLGFLENLLQLFGYSNITKEKLTVSYSLLHPKRSIVIKSNDKVLGFFGQLTPNYKNSYLIKNPIYLLELNLIHFDISQTYTKISIFQDYSKYPKIIKDLSCIVSKDINFSLLKKSSK